MRTDALKLLLVGPYPPPHGGISVHVATAHRMLAGAGVACRVLDVARGAAPAKRRGAWRSGLSLAGGLRRHARRGWTPHLHANGHSARSWLQILGCGLAGRAAPARLLTLHSGLLPGHLETGGAAARGLARRALAAYDRVLCVNAEIRDAVAALGVPRERLAIAPAYLPIGAVRGEVPEALGGWLDGHRPLLSTALFFRPEYGFDLLLEALERVRRARPELAGLGCLVLGDGEGAPAVERALVERGFEGWVRLTGDVPHELCLTLIGRSDLFVRPALADGDALSVSEALALGVPVVASDAGARPPGATRFRSGDAGDLAARIEETLRRPRLPRPVPAEPGARETVERLLEVYRDAARRER
jgi:glycosyltransferase involved in cell wall biosynthesis